ncbi:MAG: T9SS type A sorting domain-containing protein, partial [Candidatus Electryonea clarkiae]|nr:T9SS type A sorting domain-containing protein [Candidatus Electryonea clarkiae]
YLADGWAGGLRVVDVSDQENPRIAGIYNSPGGDVEGVAVSGDYAYLADRLSGLLVVNVSDPENPEEVGFYDSPGEARGVTVSGDYAYLADRNEGLHIVNVSDPENPEETGFYDSPGEAWSVAVRGDYAYLADRYEGLRVVNVRDPENPEEAGFYDSPGDARGVAVRGDYIFLADISNLGIYRFSPLAVKETGIVFASSFQLFPAYPNPFNSNASVVFDLPTPGLVSLTVVDILGRIADELILETGMSAGRHKLSWDAGILSSGTYLLRLESENQSQIQRVTLLR